MSIWTDAKDPEWAELAKRTEEFVDKLTARGDLVVIVAPDLREDEEKAKLDVDALPAGYFDPNKAEIHLDASQLLDNRLADVKFVDPGAFYSQRAFPQYVGAVVHESAHAKHSNADFPEKINPNVLKWMTTLEETRCEGQLLEDFPQYTRYVRSIVKTLVAGDFIKNPKIIAHLGKDVYARYEVTRTALLVMAREDIGVFEPGELDNAESRIINVLGKEDYFKIRDLWLEAQNVADGDIAELQEIAEEIQKIVDPNNEKDKVDEALVAGTLTGDGSGAANVTASASSVIDQIINDVDVIGQSTVKEIRDDAGNTYNFKKNQQQEDQELREQNQKVAQNFNSNPGSGIGRGWYDPTFRLVDPKATDIGRMRAITLALKKAQYREVHKSHIRSQLPPGRLDMREALNRQAQIESNQNITAAPWKQTRRREVDNPPITLAVASDISGSMSAWQYEVSSFTWAVANSVRQMQGKVGAVAWNGKSYPLIKPNNVQPKIGYYSANGGSDGCPDAMKTLDGLMDLSFGEGVKVLAIITDGLLPNNNTIQKEITRLTQRGVIVLWILTESRGFRPKNTTVAVLRKPEEFGVVVGQKLIEALSEA